MTSLRDYLNDLVTETEQRLQSYADKYKYPQLSVEEKHELVDEYIEYIVNRLIG